MSCIMIVFNEVCIVERWVYIACFYQIWFVAPISIMVTLNCLRGKQTRIYWRFIKGFTTVPFLALPLNTESWEMITVFIQRSDTGTRGWLSPPSNRNCISLNEAYEPHVFSHLNPSPPIDNFTYLQWYP